MDTTITNAAPMALSKALNQIRTRPGSVWPRPQVRQAAAAAAPQRPLRGLIVMPAAAARPGCAAGCRLVPTAAASCLLRCPAAAVPPDAVGGWLCGALGARPQLRVALRR